MAKKKEKCGYRNYDGSLCGRTDIVSYTVIDDKEIPTCEGHQFEIYDLDERNKFQMYLIEQKIKKALRRKRRNERNKNIKLLRYDEKRKQKKIERLEKEIIKEKKSLERIQKHIDLIEKS